jgi:retinol dehydrogenase 12
MKFKISKKKKNKFSGSETSVFLAHSSEVEGVSGKYFIKKKVYPPKQIAEDLITQEKLWNLSEELLGFKFQF